jgi:NAD(P)-dependent dehydrogenase (short-subunit alcohol dehydrogenase family)
MELSGTTALITGANRGIGAAIAEALVSAGAARVYAAMRNPAPVLRESKIVPIRLDVTEPGLIAEAAARCGDVQVLVNNAGIYAGQPLIGAVDREAADREMRVNYFGTLGMSRAFAPILARNGGGAIVNVLSILGRVSAPRAGSYSASKAAGFSLTQAVRAELASQGTLVIGVMPGFVDTDMARQITAPKLAPETVALSIMDALREGREDVYPGSAADIAAGLQADPKSVERQFAGLFPVRAAAS